jgi:hypothetical protein
VKFDGFLIIVGGLTIDVVKSLFIYNYENNTNLPEIKNGRNDVIP